MTARDVRAYVGEAGHRVDVERYAELGRELTNQVVLRAFRPVRTEVVRGRAVARDHAQFAERQDLLERRRHALAGAEQGAGERPYGEFESASAVGHAGAMAQILPGLL
jgi:hypothetical protein